MNFMRWLWFVVNAIWLWPSSDPACFGYYSFKTLSANIWYNVKTLTGNELFFCCYSYHSCPGWFPLAEGAGKNKIHEKIICITGFDRRIFVNLEASEKQYHKKLKKSKTFLTPSLPQDDLEFFEFGKNWKFDDPPPSDLIWEKFEIGKTLNFRNPPSNMEHKLKTLKIP